MPRLNMFLRIARDHKAQLVMMYQHFKSVLPDAYALCWQEGDLCSTDYQLEHGFRPEAIKQDTDGNNIWNGRLLSKTQSLSTMLLLANMCVYGGHQQNQET